MSLDANKALARRYMEAWERGDQALFDEVLAPDFVDYMMGHLRTRDALIKQATDPNMVDRRNVIEDILAEDDRVAVRYTSHFTRLPTRKRLTVTGMFIVRVVNEQLVEGWGERDRLGVLQELGVVPSQEEIMARLASLA